MGHAKHGQSPDGENTACFTALKWQIIMATKLWTFYLLLFLCVQFPKTVQNLIGWVNWKNSDVSLVMN